MATCGNQKIISTFYNYIRKEYHISYKFKVPIVYILSRTVFDFNETSSQTMNPVSSRLGHPWRIDDDTYVVGPRVEKTPPCPKKRG